MHGARRMRKRASACGQVGGTKSFLEIVEIGNLESPFEENTMKNISQKVGALLENIKDSDL